MSLTWESAGFWLIHSALGGGLLLLLTRGLMACARQPALRQRLGECGLAAALAVAGLSLLPAWLIFSWDLGAPSAPATTQVAVNVPAAPPVNLPDPVAVPRQIREGQPVNWQPEPVVAPVNLPGPDRPKLAPAGNAVAAGSRFSRPMVETILMAFFVVYVAGVLWFLTRLGLGLFSLARLVRASTPAPEPVTRLLREVTGERRLPRLLVSPRLRTPLSFGLVRPTIVLPAALCAGANREPLRWVLRHEWTHLQRRDAWSGLLCAMSRAVFFFVPWAWAICRHVRLCQEYLADAAAVEEEQRRADYAEFLLTLTRTAAPPLVATGVTGSCSDLFRRVTMLLQKSMRMQRRPARHLLVPAACLLLALAVLVSGFGLRALADEQKQAAAAAGDQKQAAAQAAQQQAGNPAQKAQPGDPANPVPFGPGKFKLPGGGFGGVGGLPGGGFGGGFGPGLPNPFAMPGFEDMQKLLEKLQNAKTPDEIQAINLEMLKIIQKNQGAMFGPNGFPGMQGFGGGFPGLQLPGAQLRLGAHVAAPNKVVVEQLNLPAGQGMVVSQILKDSAADKAGFKQNDILLKLGGSAVPSDMQQFNKMVEEIKADMPIDAVVLRKGKQETIKGLTLPKAAPQPANPFGGFGGGGFGGGVGGFGPGGFGGGFPAGGAGGFGFAGPGGGQINVNRDNDKFTANYQDGNVNITVTGSVDQNNMAQVGDIAIQEGAQISGFKNLNDVPAQHKQTVTNLLNTVNKGFGQNQIQGK